MNQGSNLELALFSDVPEQDTLETLYDLNQENTPEVGSLSSVNELRSLIQLSALNFFVLNEEEIITGQRDCAVHGSWQCVGCCIGY